MPKAGYFVDSMLLVLLVAGRTNPAIIARHRRLDAYSVQDYAVLQGLLADAGGVVYATPNTLTEASNLLRYHQGQERDELSATLTNLIDESQEVVVASRSVAESRDFIDLGLTDAVLLETISTEQPLLTADAKLYAVAIGSNAEAAINFNHHRIDELATSGS